MKFTRWLWWVLLATVAVYLFFVFCLLPLLAQKPELRVAITQIPIGEGMGDGASATANCGYVSVHSGPDPDDLNVGDTFVSNFSWAEVLNQQCTMRFTVEITKSVDDLKPGTPLEIELLTVNGGTFEPGNVCMFSVDRSKLDCTVVTPALGSHRFSIYWKAARFGWVELTQDFPGSIGQPRFYEVGWVELIPPTPTPRPTVDPSTLRFRGYLPIIDW